MLILQAIPRSVAAALIALSFSGCIELSDPSGQGGELAHVPTWSAGDYWHYHDSSNGTWINLTVIGQEKKSGFETYFVSEERSDTGSSTVYPTRYWIDVDSLSMVAAAESSGAEYSQDCPSSGIFPLEKRQFSCTTEFYGYKYHREGAIEPVRWGWIDAGEKSFWSVMLHMQGRSWGPGTDMPIDEEIYFSPTVGNVLFQEGEGCWEDANGVWHCSLAQFELFDWQYAA